MSLSIRTNVSSLNAQRNLYSTQNSLDSSLSRLSSGYRITKAGDDAAGLGISTNLEAQIRSYAQAVRNANDGLSVIQTTEAALNESANILTRLRELAMESASDGIGDTERTYVDTEAQKMIVELDRIATVTEYNGVKLLDGVTLTSLEFQVGVRDTVDDQIQFDAVDATVATLLAGNTIDLTSQANSVLALGYIDDALVELSTRRADLGAAGNQFQSAINSIQAFSESLSAANSRIRDVDVAEETSRLSRANILSQAGVSVLAQANQIPQMALKLLQ